MLVLILENEALVNCSLLLWSMLFIYLIRSLQGSRENDVGFQYRLIYCFPEVDPAVFGEKEGVPEDGLETERTKKGIASLSNESRS